jgi:glucitol operon activator protein
VTRLGLIVLITGLGAGWALQLYLTHLQARRFSETVRAMRRQGRAAVGRGGSRYRGMAYCALAADDTDTIVAACVLRGATVFARPKPAPDLIGRPLRELIQDPDSSAIEQAAAEAAGALVAQRGASEGGEAYG